MIAYRAEVWCDGTGPVCRAGYKDGIAHDNHTSLPGLARNQEAILLAKGWTKDGDKHFCPKCSTKAKKKTTRPEVRSL